MHDFLRLAPRALLQQYLTALGIGEPITWDAPDAEVLQEVFTAIERASDDVCRRLHSSFRQIYQLADEVGMATLQEEAARRDTTGHISDQLSRWPTSIGKAFWAYLNANDVFAVAARFHRADIQTRWHRTGGLPRMHPAMDKAVIARLTEDLTAYYQECQGRGYGCVVFTYPRDARHYWFFYPQDYAEEVFLFNEQHQAVNELVEMAFEIIFVYDAEDGTLAIATSGDFKHVADLERLFGRAVLDTEIRESPKEHYRIQCFLDRDYTLPLFPEDVVESVHVRRIGIEFLGHMHREIILMATDAEEVQGIIYEMLDKVLAGFHMPRDLVTVTRVELAMRCRPAEGKHPCTHIIRLTPRACSVTHGPLDDEFRQLLCRWDIYAAPRNNHA